MKVKQIHTELFLRETQTDGHAPIAFMCNDLNIYYCKYLNSLKKEEITCLAYEVSKIQSDVLRYILFEDDIIERYKEAIEFIKQESACTEKRCELISFYTVNEEYANAQQELSEIA